jgi:5-formyltetrahydrofolate cyclo-ligase
MPSAGELEEVARAKHAVRERVWARLETDHDFRLDLIVAGEEVITCRRARRPKGLLWDHLDAAKIAAIPALAARTRQDGPLRP